VLHNTDTVTAITSDRLKIFKAMSHISLGCDDVQWCHRAPMYRRSIPPPSSRWIL